ncbi:MAG TPA: LysM peptidoglycan-binding domain-containing protein [Candidatus Obscuribacterales bacterium]
MPSPFFREQSFGRSAPSAGGGGIGTGTKELSYAGLSAGAETGIGAANGAPMSAGEAAQAAAAKASAEASALSAQAFTKTTAATVGIGHAAIGKATIGNAAIGQGAVGNAAIGQGAVGNSAFSQTSLSQSVFGKASVGNATIGQAAVGQAAAGHAAIGHAAIGHAAIAHVAVGHATLAQAAIGNAAIAQSALAAATEPISPLVQLIMRLPGATGIAHSFFEWLAHMFMPGGHDLMSALTPHLDLAAHAAALEHVTGLLPAGEHFAGMTNLPLDAPILQGMQHTGALSGFESGGISGLPEHFVQNPANVGAGPDFAHAQFEQAASGSADSGLAGPSMSGSTGGSYLAGNQRLFSDNLSGGGQFNSITSNTSVPVTSASVPNAVTSVGQDMNQMSAQAASQTTASGSAPVSDATGQSQQFGPSAYGQKYTNDNVVASDNQVYRPATGNYYQGGSAGGGDVTPLKAKQLTFEDLRKGVVGDHGKQLIDKIAGKHASIPPADHAQAMVKPTASAPPKIASVPPHVHPAAHVAKPHVTDAIAHRGSLPKAYETGAHHEAAHHVAHHSVHHQTEAAQAPKEQPAAGKQDQAAQSDQSQVAQGDQMQIAQAGDQPADYMVQKGDCLWNIAKHKLGDGSRWNEIYKLNSDMIGQNPDLILQGAHLRLPGADNMVADAAKYTVQRGDNLWNIAKSHMGSAYKWTDLYKANSGVIGSNPSLIQPGQQLSMPGANVAQAPAANAVASGQMPAGSGADMTGGSQDMSMQSQAAPMDQPAATMPAQPAPMASESVIKVVPQHDLPDGPGAAGAATLKPASNSVVSTSLAPDLSFLDQRK